jgi:hypothetical protein
VKINWSIALPPDRVALNASQCVVVDHLLITKPNDRVAFSIESSLLQPLILRRCHFGVAFLRIFGALLKLLDAFGVFTTEPIDRLPGEFIVFRKSLQQCGRLVGVQSKSQQGH